MAADAAQGDEAARRLSGTRAIRRALARDEPERLRLPRKSPTCITWQRQSAEASSATRQHREKRQ
jgi:hypothetical protein